MAFKKLWLDFESFWSDEFTLKKMSPIEYINDPRFEALGCGFIDEDDTEMWVDGPDLPTFFRRIDWANTMAISHNALFDMVILSARYGIIPGMYGDTLSMARNWLSHRLSSLRLEKLAEFYGLPPKMQTVFKTKGVGYAAMLAQPDLHAEVKTYAVDDAGKCRTIFRRMMADGFPQGELEVIDMVIRMATEPRFELDMDVLAAHLNQVLAQKKALLDAIGLNPNDLSSIMSDSQLSTKLLHLGVNPIPTKISKTTGKQAFAFAKTDKAFQDLLEHDEPLVQALVAARLGHKSTLEETRTERLMAIGRVATGMPVPLKYSGAHTHRFSGDWAINLQNLRRGGELRKSLKAPAGYKVVAVDASQIEARFNATMSGETDLVEAFRRGEDVYCSFADDIYGYHVDAEQHKAERFVGKTGILSLGYGSSWPVFQNMCRVQGNVILQDKEASRIVGLYRQRYKNIVRNWSYAQRNVIQKLMGIGLDDDGILRQLQQREDEEADMWGPLKIAHNALILPNGNRLRYRDLHYQSYDDGTGGHTFKRGDRDMKIYGAKLVENVIQALSFLHIMETAVRVKRLITLMPQHQVHDELIYIVEDRHAEMVSAIVAREMARSPSWMPLAPLAAKGHIGQTYYDAK